MGLAYAHLNLTRNPFGEASRSERLALVVAEVDDLVDRLRRPGFAIQLLGEKGRGKTSHLYAIRARLPEAPYVYVEERGVTRVPRGQPLLVDEVQRLGAWRRRSLFRRGVSLALGTHVDFSREIEAAGLEVRTVRPGERTDVDRLDAIVRRRIEWARRGPGPVPRVPRHVLASLLATFGDDLRAIENALYEAVQRTREVADVEL